MKKPIDYNSIKSLREHGIGINGNHAYRLNPEEDIARAAERIEELLKKCIEAAKKRKNV